MARALTTLTSVISEPIAKMDMLLKYFFAADESQSSFAPLGTVKSFPKIAAKYQAGVELTDTTRDALIALMSPYFDSVEVKVTSTEINSDKAHYSLSVVLNVYQDGKGYDGTDTRTIKDSFITKFG